MMTTNSRRFATFACFALFTFAYLQWTQNHKLHHRHRVGNGTQEHLYLKCTKNGSIRDCELASIYENDGLFREFYKNDLTKRFNLIYQDKVKQQSINTAVEDKSIIFLSIPTSFYQLLMFHYYSEFFPERFDDEKGEFARKVSLSDPPREAFDYDLEFNRILDLVMRDDFFMEWKKKMDKRIFELLKKKQCKLSPASKGNDQIFTVEDGEMYLQILKDLNVANDLEFNTIAEKYDERTKGLTHLPEKEIYEVIKDNLKLETKAFPEGKLLFVRGNFYESLDKFDVTSEGGCQSWAASMWSAITSDLSACVGAYYGPVIFYRSLPIDEVFDFMYVHPLIVSPILDFFRKGELTHDRFKAVLQKNDKGKYGYAKSPVVTVSACTDWQYDVESDKELFVDNKQIIGRKVLPKKVQEIREENASGWKRGNDICVLKKILSEDFGTFKKGIIEKKYGGQR